ncbi:MAG TPA: inositol monophosphatase family protein [Jatrophihabitans sp.]|nr:inositol monophosphatase family protein [Jatrophihabitans sp.]
MPDDHALAGELVRAAGDLAARMLRSGLQVEHKTSISDVVSAADRAAEELIADRLRDERPDDGIVGEEGTDERGSGRTWYVDPVDGTYNFLSGLPEWCSALARAGSDADDVIGAIYQPSSRELWMGGAGAPTTRNGATLPPLAERALAEVSLATYLHPTRLADDTLRMPWLRVLQASATVRMLGSGSLELAAIAAGRLGASLQPDTLPWDWLPGAALVRAAGGAAEEVEAGGHRWHVAGNRRAVGEIAALLSKGAG